MNRRTVLKFGGGFSAAVLLARELFSAGGAAASEAAPLKSLPLAARTPFTENTVTELARQLAKSPYRPPEDTIPQSYKDLDYDRYRAIRFRKNLALWRGDNLGFTAELFSAGYIYRTPVKVFVVEGSQASEIAYNPDIFTYGPEVSRPPDGSRPGFSGIRIHAPIEKASVMDEFAVFQGASYFRAKAAGQVYGISGRGLAINTAQPPMDEFPVFRRYWLVQPQPGSRTVTVFALLDSASVSGAYKFVISAGSDTVMDVDCTLFPRAAMPYAGIAPLTSMFYFAPGNSYRADEARLRVHDSDGLAILNGKGEHLWRPLINPPRVQYSAFADGNVKGFGLVQRERRADHYQDIDARYEARPSVWVEPKEGFTEGAVELVELPTKTEYFDNIVAFWHPREPLQPGAEYTYRYRLNWCEEPPAVPGLAMVTQTLTGASTRQEGARLFYIDFAGTERLNLCDEAPTCPNNVLELSSTTGKFESIAIRRNQIAGGHRVSFDYRPEPGILQADLRCVLAPGGKQLSEVWLFRWAA